MTNNEMKRNVIWLFNFSDTQVLFADVLKKLCNKYTLSELTNEELKRVFEAISKNVNIDKMYSMHKVTVKHNIYNVCEIELPVQTYGM